MTTISKPNPEDISTILAGHGKWLRDEPDGERADFAGADLTRASLAGADLTRANLYGASLTRANLVGASLTWANLTGASLVGADLTGADLAGADLTGADLTESDLTRANLYGASLVGASLVGASLTGASLVGASLTGANLTEADLTGADLTLATLPSGNTWEQYLAEVVPALLAAGGHAIDSLLAAKAWDCHAWTNCPMAFAFGVHELAEVPILLRPRASEFVGFFDAKLIPMPRQLADGTWTCQPEPKQTPVVGD